MKTLQDNTLFLEALNASSAFDPLLREAASKKISFEVLATSNEVPARERMRVTKAVARNLFKRYLIEAEPMLVEDGIALSQEDKIPLLEDAMGQLQKFYHDAYLETNNAPPSAPLGYFAVRSGEEWVEIHSLKSALNPDIQALRNRAQETNYFG